ncbi:methyltransferase family protein [Nocardia pseudobrasiliensis]|uniref:Methyltransferase family protein n=1 Tax=Nocardia pseudobrasiliensis TaxID=45979 RepID=A0A370I4C6_9NOCA|nr:methyltransferase family protein [Nocardia pseudobrasiliensis]
MGLREQMTEGYREQVSRNRLRFKTIARTYADGQGRRLDGELLAELIRPVRFEFVLDVATGTGAAAAVAAKVGAGAKIIGVDSSAEMLVQARAAGVLPVVGIVEELPFADGAFDLVLCTRALHHVRHPAVAVAELARVVRPGGHLVVADNVTGLSGAAHERVETIQRLRDPGHSSTLTEDRIVELLQINSLDVLECRRTTSYRPLAQWLADGGAGAQESAEVRRHVAALEPSDDEGVFGTNFVTEAGEVAGLRQAMSWIKAQKRNGL